MYITENDIRVVLTQRDINILLEKNTGGDNGAFLTQRVLFAIEVVKSKIQHRYDPEQIFIDAKIFNISDTYAVDDLIFYSELAYDITKAYVVDDRVSYENNIYINIQGTTGDLPTDPAFWTLVIENNRYYSALQISTGNYPDDPLFYLEGDTRNQLIFTYTTYIAVYELFKKVQPTQVPAWIISSRDEAIEHLARINRGTDTVLLPTYTDDDQKGQEITYDFPHPNQNYDF